MSRTDNTTKPKKPHATDKAPAKSSAPSSPSQAPTSPAAPERIAKFLARAGVASRRQVESMIEEGRVQLNGTLLTTPATLVTAADRIVVDGKPVNQIEPTRLWRLHKAADVVTTHNDPEGRETVFDRLPTSLPRVISVGRLDLTTSGLLLLTNDGGLARTLELPKNAIPRAYRVRVFGALDEVALDDLKHGITLDKIHYGPIEASLERSSGHNHWLYVRLHEGKNREIRKVMEHLGLTVNRLIRIAYGPFQLGTLPLGAVEEVPRAFWQDALKSYLNPSTDKPSDK